MENVWFLASLWVGLALIATLLAIWLKISTALSEIVVGTVAQLVIGAFVGGSLGGQTAWVTFLAGAGSILLTFLAGAELDPLVFRRRWREATVIGLIPTAMGLEAGTESNRPLALAVVGGLTSSTVLSLFLVPVMFLLLAKKPADAAEEDEQYQPSLQEDFVSEG